MIKLQHKKIGNYIMLTNKKVVQLKHSTIFLGLNTLNKKKVLIKTISKQQYLNNDVLFNSFNFELNTMQMLREENILKPLELITTEKNFYLILQEPHGESLKKTISKRGPLKQKQLREHLKKIKPSFSALLKNNIIHGNINSKSILLDHNKIVLGYPSYVKTIQILKLNSLSTLGIQSGAKTQNFQDYAYLPPQLLSTGIVSLKQDIWSLGVVLYQALTGKLPWNFKDCTKPYEIAYKIISQEIKFPQNIKISRQMKHFLLNCLEIDPLKRFDWEQVLEHKIFNVQINSSQQNDNSDQTQIPDQQKAFLWSYGQKMAKTNYSLTQ